MADVEVYVGDGSLKEKPKNRKKNEKKEELLVRGTDDEEMVLREFDERETFPQQPYKQIQEKETIQPLQSKEEEQTNKEKVLERAE